MIPKPVNQEKKEPIEQVKVDRNSFVFILQKELEKVKIFFPLAELLKQPSYKR